MKNNKILLILALLAVFMSLFFCLHMGHYSTTAKKNLGHNSNNIQQGSLAKTYEMLSYIQENSNTPQSDLLLTNTVNTYASDTRHEWVFMPASENAVLYLTKEEYSKSITDACSGICLDLEKGTLSILKGFRTFSKSDMEEIVTVSLKEYGVVPELGKIYVLIMERSDTFKVKAKLCDVQTGKSVVITAEYKAGRGWGTVKHRCYGALQYSSLSGYAINISDIGVIGDSFTEGGSMSTAYMCRYPTATGIFLEKSITVSAKAGARSSEGLKWLKEYYLDTYSHKYVVLEFGMNDIDYTVWESNIIQMIQLLEDNGINPILCTVPPFATESKADRNGTHAKMSEWVRNSGYRYIDWEHLMTKEHDGIHPDVSCYMTDGIHPSVTVQLLAARELENILLSMS